jgi:hypothetical protein
MQLMPYRAIPFAARRARPARLGAQYRRGGLRGLSLGNVKATQLSDYINSPGLPGSSTFFMYGLNDDGTQDTTAPATDFWATLSQNVTDVVKAAAPAYTAIELAKINADRARQGLPPYQPQPLGIQGSIAPGTLGAGLGGILLIGAIGLGAVFLLRKRR